MATLYIMSSESRARITAAQPSRRGALQSAGPNSITDLSFYITMFYNSFVRAPPAAGGI
jgi:hypothetical protein